MKAGDVEKKKDPLAKLRHTIKKVKTLNRVQNRNKSTPKEMTRASLDMQAGLPGLFKSSRPVYAFDVDCEITLEKLWGKQQLKPGDFLVLGEPKASTGWHTDVYSSPRDIFLKDFIAVPGTFCEYCRSGTMYASSLEADQAYGKRHAKEGTEKIQIKEHNSSGGNLWLVKKSSTGASLRSDGEDMTLDDKLFREAFEPVFLEYPDAHEIMMETIDLLRIEDPKAELTTIDFGSANTLYVLAPGDIALVTAGQFKIGRMGAKANPNDQKRTPKMRRASYMNLHSPINRHAFLLGECIGPSSEPSDVVTLTDNTCELLVIPANIVKQFSGKTLQALNRLSSETSSRDNVPESAAERLERICKEFFSKCDNDNSGSISPLEFSRELRKQGKKFGPKFKDWLSRPLLIFEQIDEDGSGSIEEQEFLNYVLNKGDAMLLGIIVGSDSRSGTVLAKNAGLAQREATEALVESLRERLYHLEVLLAEEKHARMEERETTFLGILKSAMLTGASLSHSVDNAESRETYAESTSSTGMVDA